MNPDLILDHQTVVRRCGEDQGSDTVNAAYLPVSGGSSGVAEWAVPTQNQMTYFFLILFSFLNLSIIYLMICY
jgi:hypothetical protein